MHRQKIAAADAWAAYDDAVIRGFEPLGVDAIRFAKERMARGVLSLPVSSFATVLAAPRIAFSSDLTATGYATSNFKQRKAEAISSSSHFRQIIGPLEFLLCDCVSQLWDPVAQLLGTPWRILNVRAWTTPPNADASVGMYAFHLDGMPEAIFKIMIYFTPMDAAHGSLEISPNCVLLGPPNSWVLFYNSSVMHRGCPGTSRTRACAEITLSRSKEFDLVLHQPGLNAQWPVNP